MAAAFSFETRDDIWRLRVSGEWRARFLGDIDEDLRKFQADSVGHDLIIDLDDLTGLDTAGAMVLQRVMRACTHARPLLTFVVARARTVP